jgi:hypothetical protein
VRSLLRVRQADPVHGAILQPAVDWTSKINVTEAVASRIDNLRNQGNGAPNYQERSIDRVQHHATNNIHDDYTLFARRFIQAADAGTC